MNCPHCQAPNAPDARFCGSCGKATAPTTPTIATSYDAPPPVIGREVAGRYRILAKLGEGGMGAVYRAEQISLKRTVALKMLRPDVGGSQTLLRRFNAEAEAVAKLSHPNTVNIIDFGSDTDGTLFIAMELIEGRSLRTLVQSEAPLPLRRSLAIAAQIAASIADAHSHAIIHRDLKPDNVMLQDRGKQKDVVRVLDFGIAKLRDDTRQNNAMTQAGDMLGTPQYMAPEQIRAEAIDGRTDVYALGCILYEMLTARLPFEAPTVMALLSKHLMETPLPPSQRRPELGLPPMIDDLVMGAMAKDPARRPATMELLGEHITAVLATLPPDPTGPSAPISVPYVPAQMTPPASFAPSTPPPPGAAFTPALTPPVMHGPPPVLPTPQRPKSDKTLVFVILGVLALFGAGAAAYFATRPDPKPEPRRDDPWKNAQQPDDPDDKPDKPDEPDEDKEPPPEPDAASPDPWGGKTSSAGASTSDLAGASVDVGQGAKFVAPPGFVAQQQGPAISVVDTSRGIMFGFGPMDADTDDVKVLAKRYARLSGLKLRTTSQQFLHGANRPFAVFDGKLGGIAVRHVVIGFVGSSYRLAMIIHVPQALANDATVQALAAEAVTRRLQLP
jgi:serine/threonine protein kinase